MGPWDHLSKLLPRCVQIAAEVGYESEAAFKRAIKFLQRAFAVSQDSLAGCQLRRSTLIAHTETADVKLIVFLKCRN
jgi:hypothetical protein